VNQKNKIDPPTIYQGNKFANLVILDLDVTPEEISSFNIFTNYVHRYGFTKFSLQEKKYTSTWNKILSFSTHAGHKEVRV
jgi:hypothetical protein